MREHQEPPRPAIPGWQMQSKTAGIFPQRVTFRFA